MDIAISEVGKIVRAYQTQTKIAEINKESDIKVVQGQVDRVTISAKGRQLAFAQETKADSQPAAGPNGLD